MYIQFQAGHAAYSARVQHLLIKFVGKIRTGYQTINVRNLMHSPPRSRARARLAVSVRGDNLIRIRTPRRNSRRRRGHGCAEQPKGQSRRRSLLPAAQNIAVNKPIAFFYEVHFPSGLKSKSNAVSKLAMRDWRLPATVPSLSTVSCNLHPTLQRVATRFKSECQSPC